VSDGEAVVRWLAVMTVVWLAAVPLAAWLCRPLATRGAGVAAPLGLLLVVWPGWFAAAGFGLPYATWMPWASGAVLGAFGWIVAVRAGAIDRRLVGPFGSLVTVWVAAFLAAAWVRGFTPDLTGTEKPMDAAFLSASAIATAMPPADPWFAGEPINYYYLGYVLFGAVARMAGIPATTAYNLAIPTLFASAFVAAAGFGFDAVRGWGSRRLAVAAAGASGVLLAVAGNLYAPLALLRHGRETIDAWWWDGAVGIGWRSSRIVCDGPRVAGECAYPSVETINEFPFFSFLLADLHPHVMALPITVLVLALALARVLRPSIDGDAIDWPWALVAGAVAGSLYAVNSWDFPTFLAALVGSVLLARRRIYRGAVLEGAAMTAAAVLAWLPFWVRFEPPAAVAVELPSWLGGLPVLPRLAGTIGIHGGERTSLGEFLTVFGASLALATWMIGYGSAVGRRRAGRGNLSAPPWLVGLLGGAAVLALLLGAPVLLLAAGLLAAGVRLLTIDTVDEPIRVGAALVALAAALCAVVEVVYLRDVFDDRMNTLFKVYYQVWTLLAFAGAIGLATLWRAARSPLAKLGAGAAAAALAALVLAYPAVATWQWTGRFGDRRGLDGIAYAADRYPGEHAAIVWLRENAGPNDVVLEAAGCSYQPIGDLPFGRVSAYTGRPTVIGWAGHERQWRAGQPALLAEIEVRQDEVAEIYADPDGPVADRHGVAWLVVGRYEGGEDWRWLCDVAGPYPGVDRREFPGPGWTLAFDGQTTRIWRRDAPSLEPSG
jgi:YYY domain-containing protein